jgi:predicted enzyme related to lactoylglutathione lyase
MPTIHRPLRAGRAVAAALSLLLLAACAPSLPPVTESPTGEHHPGRFVWFDLLSEDPAAAEAFYAGVFGWRFEDSGTADYRLIRSGDALIGGVAETDDRESGFSESRWLATLSVDDVDAALARAEAAGGEVLVRPVDVQGRGRLAALRDPSGAVLVLLRTEGGDPADGVAPPVGSFLWTDLWTEDAATARRFYGEVVGYQSRTAEVGAEHRYEILGRDGRARAGLVVIDLEGIDANWLPYVRVADVAGAAEQARQRGGTVLLERADLAVLIDPTGAAIGVQKWDGRSGS